MKIQSHGINKNFLNKLHQRLLEKTLLESGAQVSDENINELREFAELNSRTMLFGVSEVDTLETDTKVTILEEFGNDYGGINLLLKNEAHNRSYDYFSDWVIEKLKFAERSFIRAVDSVPMGGEEAKYIEAITTLEKFLLEVYSVSLAGILANLESKVQAKLIELYESDLSEDEKSQALEDFLNDLNDTALAQLLEQEAQLNDKAIELAVLAIGVLGLAVLSAEQIGNATRSTKYQFASNVMAFLFNSFRGVKETFNENIFNRSLQTEQAKQTVFNKRTYQLSVVTHARGLFRKLISMASDKEYYKAVIALYLLPNLKPSGVTASVLYEIKTKDEWSKTNGLGNIAVVDGLGLHHGDQIYYLPVDNSNEDKLLSRQQRGSFLKQFKN